MIAALKFLHIAALTCWCASLIALPLLMRANGATASQHQYVRFRLITHVGYIGFATPAALVTIIAGTGLIFAAQVFEPWLLVKLGFVAAMVMIHVWFGHLIQRSGEERRTHWHVAPLAGLVILLPLIAGVLALVLGKPDLASIRALIPDQFLSPRGGAS